MPTYEYLCQTCKAIKDVVRGFNNSEEPVECEQCGDTMKRVYGVPAIQFKGSGFYKTDHGGK
jgi:putative FmdB family regulatory protein